MRTRAAAIIINNKNEILLMHRFKNGQEYFVFPGGKVEEHETPTSAVIREIFEEVTLTINTVDSLIFERTNENQDIEKYFLVTQFSGTVTLSGEEKDRMTEENQYYPEWWKLEKAEQLENLVPIEAKDGVFQALRNHKR